MDKNLIKEILKFRNDRNWKQFHNGKDLALSLSLEANELLEVYQWSGQDLDCLEKIDNIKEELADVFMYAVLIADNYNLDIKEIIEEKIKKNNEKYPLDISSNSSKKYNKL